MSDRRSFRWATTSARLLAGTLVAIGFAVAVVTGVSLPWPQIAREPVVVTATPSASASVVVCSGGLLALGRDVLDAGLVATAAPQAIVSGVDGGAPEPATEPLAGPAPDGIAPPVAVVADPLEGVRTDVAAAGSSTVAADDLSGFAASACRPSLMESWLVGGAATTGAADLVLIANAGTVAATVQLTVYGADGPQVPPGGADLVVGPGRQIVIPLAGLRLGEESPVVRVTATGGPVHATLQASITRTLVPGGIDQVGAIAVPESVQVVAGVEVTQNPGAEGASDAATVVRILSPTADTTATVTPSPVGMAQPATAPITVPLAAGVPTEVDLGGLAAGQYTVEVAAGAPIVTAVWQATGFGEGSDFAWYTPAPHIGNPSLFATPPGPAPALTLANTADSPITVTVRPVDGSAPSEVTVGARESTTVRLSARTAYVLDAGVTGIRAGLSLSGDGAIAGYPVWPSDAAAQQIEVYR